MLHSDLAFYPRDLNAGNTTTLPSAGLSVAQNGTSTNTSQVDSQSLSPTPSGTNLTDCQGNPITPSTTINGTNPTQTLGSGPGLPVYIRFLSIIRFLRLRFSFGHHPPEKVEVVEPVHVVVAKVIR